MKNKVMVEVGDLEKLKEAVEAYEPWVETGDQQTLDLVAAYEHMGILVGLAKRVVAEEERVLAAIAAPSDYNKY
tara:strand:+ start:749 stop:970 length:222 start_codon:yes stop_codon:yes gene_type:complete